MRGRRRWFVLSAVLVGAGGLLFRAALPSDPPLEVVTLTGPPPSAPAMCPWREPDRDLRLFFPGAATYRTDVLILSRLRTQIIRQLGPHTPLESNALYLYRIQQGPTPRGTVLVRRTAGRFGAMEVVVALDRRGRIIGVRLQRHREPLVVASILTSPHWLGAFRGKTAASRWKIGEDIPAVPAEARVSAEAMVRAVRALLIEWEIGERQGLPTHH